MQINRLDLLILPGTAAAAKPSDPQAPETRVDSDTGARSSDAIPATAAPQRKPAPGDLPIKPDTPVGVKLTLNSSQRADTSTYSRESIAAASAFSRNAPVTSQTPAEQFVASAVRIMRDMEQGKLEVLGSDAASFNHRSSSKLASAFGGLRQAVAKLNALA